MKKGFIIVAVVSLMLLLAGTVGAQTSPPWMSYSPPESSYMGLEAYGYYDYFHDGSENNNNRNNGNVRLRYWQFMDSPTFGYDINASLSFAFKGSDDTSEAGEGLDLDLNSLGHTSVKYYFTPENDLFGYFGINASAAGDSYALVGSLGAGYGRYKDVTPLGRAAQLERDLMDIGDVTMNFGPAFLVALAQETERVHAAEETEAEKAERIAEFIEANAPGNVNLSPAGVITVADVLTADITRRTVGWEVRGGLGYPIVTSSDDRSVEVILSGSLGLPIAFDTQVNAQAQVTSPFNNFFDTFKFDANVGVTYSLTDDVDLTGALTGFAHRNAPAPAEGDIVTGRVQMSIAADVRIIEGLSMEAKAMVGRDHRFNAAWDPGLSYGFNTSLRYRFF